MIQNRKIINLLSELVQLILAKRDRPQGKNPSGRRRTRSEANLENAPDHVGLRSRHRI